MAASLDRQLAPAVAPWVTSSLRPRPPSLLCVSDAQCAAGADAASASAGAFCVGTNH